MLEKTKWNLSDCNQALYEPYGYWLGMAMVKVAIATILRHHRVELAARERIDYMVRPALTPRGKVRATLHRQDGNFAAALIRGNISTLVRSCTDA